MIKNKTELQWEVFSLIDDRDYNGEMFVSGCSVAIHEGELVVSYNGGWAEFYLSFDKQNTDLLRDLIGGSIRDRFPYMFSSDDPFDGLRQFCDKNNIQYSYTSWSSGDDWDDIEDSFNSHFGGNE